VPPGFIPPCQPVLSDRVPSGDGWLHEFKHDGFRIIARKEGDHVRLRSRNGRDWSAEFVAITAALRGLPADFLPDGRLNPATVTVKPERIRRVVSAHAWRNAVVDQAEHKAKPRTGMLIGGSLAVIIITTLLSAYIPEGSHRSSQQPSAKTWPPNAVGSAYG